MKIDTTDISKTASTATIVFEALRKAIIEGELEVGEPLRQDEIARMFATSRIPVREALSRLEEQGLVTTQRYKGAFVSGLSASEASEIFDFRSLVEGDVVFRAVPRMTEADLETARDYCQRFAASTEPMEWGNLNRSLHAALYRPCGLSYHLSVIENAMDRVDPYLRAQLVLSNGMDRAIREHNAILDACVKRDAEKAAQLTRAHIEGAKISFLDHLNGQAKP